MLRSLLKAFGLLLALSTAAAAQDYPTKPVRLIIPFAPGGSVDIVARLVASKLSERLGQQVTPDNRAGAGGIIAAELASKAPTDGYTLVLLSLAHTVNPHIYKVGYDPLRAFSPCGAARQRPERADGQPVGAGELGEGADRAREKQAERYAFAHAGVGSFTHTASVLFAMMAGIEVEQIPFKGGGPAMIDVMGGHSHLLMNSYLASVPHVRSGKLKPLGVSDLRRTHLLPEVPTIDEAGVPGYQAANWWGIGVPAGTPQPVIDKLSAAILAVLSSDDVKKQFDTDGASIVPMNPAQFTKFFADEYEKWGKVVKEAKIKPE